MSPWIFTKEKCGLFSRELDDISLSNGGWFHFIFFLAINEISQGLRVFRNWLGENFLKTLSRSSKAGSVWTRARAFLTTWGHAALDQGLFKNILSEPWQRTSVKSAMFLLNLPSSFFSLAGAFPLSLFIIGLWGEILLICHFYSFCDFEYVCWDFWEVYPQDKGFIFVIHYPLALCVNAGKSPLDVRAGKLGSKRWSPELTFQRRDSLQLCSMLQQLYIELPPGIYWEKIFHSFIHSINQPAYIDSLAGSGLGI